MVDPDTRERSRGKGDMRVLLRLRTAVRDDPAFMRRLNGWLVIVWLVMIPISMAFNLLSSVAYVSALSLWALVSGHWSGWQAARVEVAQEMEARRRLDEPIEEKVVEKLIHDTTVEALEQRDDSSSAGLGI
jgi:hypothetical protein